MKKGTLFLVVVMMFVATGCVTTDKHIKPISDDVFDPTSTRTLFLDHDILHQKRVNDFIRQYPEPLERDKIEFLLKSINTSKLTFARNGGTYNSNQAMRWLRWKFNKYYKDLSSEYPMITAQIFINRISTKSNKTGKFYELITREGKRMKARDLLNSELRFLEKAIADEKSRHIVLVEPVVDPENKQTQSKPVIVPIPIPAQTT